MGKGFRWKRLAKKSSSGVKQGAKSTVQLLSSVTGGDRLFNGGSPILFNATKAMIIRAFRTENVFRFIDYHPDMTVDQIQEDTFDLVEPTEDALIHIPLAADTARAQENYNIAIADIEGSGLSEAQVALKALEARENRRRALENVHQTRLAYMAIFDKRHEIWLREKEKFDLRQATLLKVFQKVFGTTTITTVKTYLDSNRFRRAWFEICTQNADAAAGQNNTSILLDELNNVQFDAATMSFSTLETNISLLQEQLIELGEPEPTPESKLHRLIKALKRSPGKELEHEIKYAEMSNLTYQDARYLFMRRAGEIASESTFDELHGRDTTPTTSTTNNTPQLNRVGAQQPAAKNKGSDGGCTYCGRTNHDSKHCWTQMDCNYCGEFGHVKKQCPKLKKKSSNEKGSEGNPGGRSVGNVNASTGSRFTGNLKNASVYSEALDLTNLEKHTEAVDYVTDHHMSHNAVTFLVNTYHLPNIVAQYRIILDSGASCHMLPRSLLVYNYHESDGAVRLGDTDRRLPIVGIGDTSLRDIGRAVHVQGLTIGILAVCQFDRIRFITVFESGHGKVYDSEGKLFLSFTLTTEGIYLLDPVYVQYLRSGVKPGMLEVSDNMSSTEVHTSIVSESLDSLVKPLERVSHPEYGTAYETSSTNSARVVGQPRGPSKPETDYSDTLFEVDSVTIPTAKVAHPTGCLSTTGTGGKTQPTGDTTKDTHYDDNARSPNKVSEELNPLEILHRQWGHLSADKIKLALRDGLVKGCKYTYRQIKDLTMRKCEYCLQGFMRAKPERATTSHDWSALEKIAIDYKGDFARKAVGGYKGFMLLVDYATNWLHADLVKSKSEHTRVLQDYKINTVLRYGKVWKVLQSDSESIFKSQRVRQWLRKNEIRLQLSTPYQHWQNGQVEVYVRIVMDKTRTLMVAYNTPVKFWGYAVCYTCYMLNRTPNSNTNTSAYEALTGATPDMSNAVPFYAPGVFHLTADERKDPWIPKARPCRMLGYADEYQHAYIILNVDTGRVIVRENCVFNSTDNISDIEEIEVNRDADRDDIDEFNIMIHNDDSDIDNSDADSDVSSNSNENDVANKTDNNLIPNDAIDYGGDNPYWNAILEELHFNTITIDTSYNEWRNAALYNAGLVVEPLPPNPSSVTQALSGPHAAQWETAITKELNQFRIRSTFGPAEQKGQGMKTKLILTYKYDGEYNLVCKARLVVCGYSQRKGIDYFETFSPTTTTTTVFTLICLAGYLDGHLCAFDVSAAFLEGRADTRMFAWLPKEIDKDGIAKRVEILGNWYGSKQAGKIWNDLFDAIMTIMGFTRCIENPCLYRWSDGVLYIYLTVHVDDGLMLCSHMQLAKEFMTTFLTHVRKAVMYDEAKLYLAMDITRSTDRRMFYISQQRYIEDNFGDHTKRYTTPMSSTTNLRTAAHNSNNESLLPVTGKLRYIADRTRPDILVAVGEVSTGGSEHPSDEHCGVANRIQHYVTTTKTKRLCLGGTDPIVLFGYCDAAYINTGNCKSRLGSCLFFNKSSGAISSISKNDSTVSHSSTEAEIKAIDMICRQVVRVRALLEFLGQPQTKPTKIFVDNKSAIELCRTLKTNHRVGHINIRIHYIRELINARVVELVFVSTKLNVADVLTKPLLRPAHDRHTTVLLEGHNNVPDGDVLWLVNDEYMTYEQCNTIIANTDAADAMLTAMDTN